MAAELLVDSRKGRLVLAVAVLASGMAFLDGTVVNIALPRIQEELGNLCLPCPSERRSRGSLDTKAEVDLHIRVS